MAHGLILIRESPHSPFFSSALIRNDCFFFLALDPFEIGRGAGRSLVKITRPIEIKLKFYNLRALRIW